MSTTKDEPEKKIRNNNNINKMHQVSVPPAQANVYRSREAK
jgi:hypothetical protein